MILQCGRLCLRTLLLTATVSCTISTQHAEDLAVDDEPKIAESADALVSALARLSSCDDLSCGYVTRRFESKAPRADRDVILVYDSFLYRSQITLYTRRILASYRPEPDPASFFKPYHPDIKIRSDVAQVYDAFEVHPQLLHNARAIEALAAFAEAPLKWQIPEQKSGGHDDTAFNLLAELNPDADFVIVRNDLYPRPYSICMVRSERS